jgi:hypothetical protein
MTTTTTREPLLAQPATWVGGRRAAWVLSLVVVVVVVVIVVVVVVVLVVVAVAVAVAAAVVVCWGRTSCTSHTHRPQSRAHARAREHVRRTLSAVTGVHLGLLQAFRSAPVWAASSLALPPASRLTPSFRRRRRHCRCLGQRHHPPLFFSRTTTAPHRR